MITPFLIAYAVVMAAVILVGSRWAWRYGHKRHPFRGGNAAHKSDRDPFLP